MTTPGMLRERVLPAVAAGTVIAALVTGGWYGYRQLAARPIASVVFAGDVAKIAPADLEEFAAGLRGQPVGSVSLASVRETARRIPWVRDASVRRRFPAGLEVALETHEALARWGAKALVSARGEVFSAPFTGSLPRFQGPDASAALMAQQYPAIARALAPLASPVAELRLSARGAWQVVLESGLTLELGRGDLEARLQRLVAAWPGLAARGVEIKHADLRYANGFALRRAAEPIPVKATAATAPRNSQTKKK